MMAIPLGPLRMVRTAPHRRLHHYWSTARGKALCGRNMRLQVFSDGYQGDNLCGDCLRVQERGDPWFESLARPTPPRATNHTMVAPGRRIDMSRLED